MAFRISREKRAEIDAQLTELTDAKDALDNAVVAFNDRMSEAWEAVEEAVNAYNGVRDDLVGMVDGEADDQQSQYDDKSEKWQEGDTGQAVQEWIESLRTAVGDINEVAMDKPEDLSVDDVVGGDDITIEDAPE